MTANRRAEIHMGAEDRSITVDGHRLGGVSGFTLSGTWDRIPELTVDLVVIDDTALCEECHITIPESTRETLIALGWTPPDGS